MSTIVISGSCGLIGSEAVSFFAEKKYDIVGIDNNMRKSFFGKDASVLWNKRRLEKKYKNFKNHNLDIRQKEKVFSLFKKYSKNIKLIIHTAAQPSHDWAVKAPLTDFTVNANGTLIMLEAFRQYCPQAVFIFTSTNKVYGDRPNYLPLLELDKRYELPKDHAYYKGIDESMSIDNCLHSLFGASKVAADILTQEYGKYFGLKTGVFRGGCLTGPLHSGAELHGFLSYLVKCCVTKKKYRIFGYKGKQVRDNIHSFDLVNAFYHYFKSPRKGEVYNMGGGRFANVSMLEAIEITERVTGNKLNCEYINKNRIGDHLWWISDTSKFKSHFPEWNYTYNIEDTIKQIYEAQNTVLRSAY